MATPQYVAILEHGLCGMYCCVVRGFNSQNPILEVKTKLQQIVYEKLTSHRSSRMGLNMLRRIGRPSECRFVDVHHKAKTLVVELKKTHSALP